MASEIMTLRIGKVEVGGRLGEHPLVLAGSIFYHEHKIVKDHKRGVFDREAAEKLIVQQDEWSERTGIPCMVDVVGESVDALCRYLDFVADITSSPILMNGTTADVRIGALKYASEVGLLDRLVYTSINYTSEEYEFRALAEHGAKFVLVQTFNPRNPLPRGSVEMFEGLMKGCLDVGVKGVIALSTVLDIPSMGYALETIKILKDRTGVPCAIAPCGVVVRWRRIKELGKDYRWVCMAAAIAMSRMMGADLIIYGSIRKAPKVFPVSAMIEAIIAYNERLKYGWKLSREHPLFTYL